ncbi:MAG: hypothetical protein AAF205_06250 [Pseudomonadota bacterium]
MVDNFALFTAHLMLAIFLIKVIRAEEDARRGPRKTKFRAKPQRPQRPSRQNRSG